MTASIKPEEDASLSTKIVSGFIRRVERSLGDKLIASSLVAVCLQFYQINTLFETNILTPSEQHDLVSLFNKTLGTKRTKNVSLLYQGSRDGFHHKAFLEKSNSKPCTVLLIANEHKYKFGGYTQVPWAGDGGYKTDETAFLFQIKPNCQAFKIKPDQSEYAVYHRTSQGMNTFFPLFGYWGELVVYDHCDQNQNSNCFIMSGRETYGIHGNQLCGGNVHVWSSQHWNFRVIEAELFQIDLEQ